MKKLYICGLQGHGKGFLRSLFDGHPYVINSDIITLPGLSLLKDEFINIIREASWQNKFYEQTSNDIKIIIKLNDVEVKISPARFIRYLFQNSDIDFFAIDYLLNKNARETDVKEPFDILNYLNICCHELMKNKYTSLEGLQNVFHDVYLDKYYPSLDKKTMNGMYFLQIPIVSSFNQIQDISTKLSSKKILLINRNPISSAFMNTERIFESNSNIVNRKANLFDWLYFNQYDRILFSKKYVNKFKNYYEKLDSLLKQNNKDIYVVDFDEMVLKPKQTMDKIASFLDIEVNPVLYKATLNGVPISHLSESFETGKIMHDPYKKLSKRQINMLNYLFNGWVSSLSLLQNFYLFINKIKLNLGSNKYFIRFVRFVRVTINFSRLFKKNRAISQ